MEPKEKLLYFFKQPTFLIIVGYLYLIATMNIGFTPYDSGIALTGGFRILNGELPYKDFFTIYAPGQFYLNALIQLISSEILFLRLVMSLFQLGILILIYKTSNLLFKKNYYIYSILLASFWLGGFDMWNRAIIVALFFNLLLVYNIVKSNINQEKQNYLLNAIYLSIIIFFRHDVGGITFIIYVLYNLYNIFNKKELKEIFGFVLKSILGFIPLIIFIVYLLTKVKYSIILEHLVTIPREVFPLYRSLPFPNPFDYSGFTRLIKDIFLSSAFYLPVITLFITVIYYFKNKTTSKEIVIYSLFILPMINQMIVRSELEHSLPAVVMSSVIIFYLLDNLLKIKNLLLIIFLLMLPNMIANKYKIFSSVYPDYSISKLERINNIVLPIDYNKNIENAVNYINENTAPNSKIYVGLSNHDKVLSNEAAFYYLVQRMPSTYYHELHPGVTTTLEGQQKIYYSLEIQRVIYLVLFDNEDFESTNMSSKSSEVFYLDDKIKDYFKLETAFGNIKIYKRIDEDF
jgi:hypothetical protein